MFFSVNNEENICDEFPGAEYSSSNLILRTFLNEHSFESVEKDIFSLKKLFSLSVSSIGRIESGVRGFTPVALGVTFEIGTSSFEERTVGPHGEW